MSAGAENINYKELYEASLQMNQQLLTQLAQLQGQLHTLTKLLKGFKSERFVPAAVTAEQPSLDLLFEDAAEAIRLADVQKKITYTTTKPRAKNRKDSIEANKTNIGAAINSILGIENFLIWDMQFKKVIEFSNIGVLRRGYI